MDERQDNARIVGVFSNEDHRDVKDLLQIATKLTVTTEINAKSIDTLFQLIRERELHECPVGKLHSEMMKDIEIRMRGVEKMAHEPQSKTKRVAFDFGKAGIGGMLVVLYDKLFGG